jgi:hypothetical protein
MAKLPLQLLQRLSLSSPLKKQTALLLKITCAALTTCIVICVSYKPLQHVASPLPPASAPTQEDFTASLPLRPNADAFVDTLIQVTRTNRVQVQTLERHSVEEIAGLQAASVEFRLRGTYPDIKATLASLLGGAAHARVTRLELSSEDPPTVAAAVAVTLWSRAKVKP